jgi:hypothetical protein
MLLAEYVEPQRLIPVLVYVGPVREAAVDIVHVIFNSD